MNKKIVLLAMLGALNLTPMALGQYIFLVDKQQRFDQTGDSTITPDATKPFRFDVQIGNNNHSTQDSNTPTPPNEFTFSGNPSPISLTAPTGADGDDQWTYKADFNSQAAMDAAFPNGNYSLTIGGNTGNIAVAGDLYTNAPQASFNIGGAWSGNVFSIYQGQDLIINTNAILGFTSGNFRVGIDASPSMGFNGSQSDIQFDSFDNNLVDSSGNITIPGSLLQAGQSWDVALEFNAFSGFSNSTFPGNTSVGIYTVQTQFTVSAIPEPAETVLMASTLALGFAFWRRRKVTA